MNVREIVVVKKKTTCDENLQLNMASSTLSVAYTTHKLVTCIINVKVCSCNLSHMIV